MAPPKMPWFRFYVEAVADKKLRRQKPETRWLFVACLAAARSSVEPGVLLVAEGVPMHEADLADFAGLTIRQTTAGVQALLEVGVIAFDEEAQAWFVPAWAERQYESDLSTERVRKHRRGTAMKRPIDRSNDVPATPPDTEADTETEKGVAKAGSEHHPLLSPGRPPALSCEIDEHLGALVSIHGATAVDDAVTTLLGRGRTFRWPSDARKALEQILGPPPEPVKPSPLDDTAAAARRLAEEGTRYSQEIAALPVDPEAKERMRSMREQLHKKPA